jgi:hypothetical protein
LSDVVELEVFREGEPRVLADYGERDDAASEKFATANLFPLDRHGLLGIASLEPREFPDSERDLVGVLARSVVAALDPVTDEEASQGAGDNA